MFNVNKITVELLLNYFVFCAYCVVTESSNNNWKDYYKNGEHIKCIGMGKYFNPFIEYI